jgi:HEAT repeat protein
VVEVLRPMLDDPDAHVRRYAADHLLGFAPDDEGPIEVFRQALRSGDATVESWALAAISQTRSPHAAALAPELISVMVSERASTFPQNPVQARQALKHLGMAAEPALAEALKSDNPSTRAKVASVLKEIRAAAQERAEQEGRLQLNFLDPLEPNGR